MALAIPLDTNDKELLDVSIPSLILVTTVLPKLLKVFPMKNEKNSWKTQL